ncbi:SRPBCC family protein [Dyadobacter sp. 676]|uniref:SRPBCC family protein n=1 Tax=Dyadobacter sp. 676 TaxID=3088362 RepID=A0AAU8FIU5_9BACT
MTKTTQHGRLGKDELGYHIVFERLLKHSAAKVWDALINPEKLAVWFMKTELDPVPGGRMTMHFGDAENTLSYGRIVRIEPEKYLEYVWENEDGPDELAVWELFPGGGEQTLLRFTYSRVSETYAVSVSAGWHQMLDLLADILDEKVEPAVQLHDGVQSEAGKTLEKHYKAAFDALS